MGESETLLPEIKAVTNSSQPCDGSQIQYPVWVPDYVQQHSSNANLHERPQHKDLYSRLDCGRGRKGRNRCDDQQHASGKPRPDCRDALYHDGQQTSDRQVVGNRGKYSVISSRQSEPEAKLTDERRPNNYPEQNSYSMAANALKNSRP